MIHQQKTASKTNYRHIFYICLFFVTSCLYVFYKGQEVSLFWFFKPITPLPYSSLIANIIVLILLICNAFLCNMLSKRFGLTIIRNNLALMLWLFFSVTLPTFLNVENQLVVFLFLFTLALRIFTFQDDEHFNNPKRQPYRMLTFGAWVGILSLFYFPLIVLLLLTYINYIIARTYKFRFFLLPLVGFVAVYIYSLAIIYLTDTYDIIWQYTDVLRNSFTNFQLRFDFSIEFIFIGIPIIVFILFAIYKIYKKARNVAINLRKKYNLLIFMLLLTATCALIFTKTELYSSIALSCLSIGLAVALERSKPWWELIAMSIFFTSCYYNFIHG